MIFSAFPFLKHKACKYQSGASLVELMVAVFIFAIGVLGFASLQSRSVQATFDNGQRDQVVWLTQSLVDRIRVNSVAATTYETELTDFNSARCINQPLTLCDEAGVVCASTQMAAFDVWDIYCNNQFQGVSAIKDLFVNLNCTPGVGNTCNMMLTSSWCARTIESTEGLGTSAGACDNSVAKMEYRIGFRP